MGQNNAARQRRRRRRRERKRRAEPQCSIPEDTAAAPADFFDAPDHQAGLIPLLAVAWQQATTEGLTLVIGSDGPTIDALASHTRGHIVYRNRADEPGRDNIVPLDGDLRQAIDVLLKRRYQHISMIYFTEHAADVLPQLADRLVMGTVVVLAESEVVAFCDWLTESGREAYAILRLGREAVVAMLAD